MAEELPSAQGTRSALTARFAALAETVIYRWTVETFAAGRLLR